MFDYNKKEKEDMITQWICINKTLYICMLYTYNQLLLLFHLMMNLMLMCW